MSRAFNFSAGPAVLPAEVLEQAREEMLDWHGSGMSVMEMSHRGKEFMEIAEQAESDLRELMQIPADYKVLFLQGGASSQFAMVPLNLLRGKASADYFNTGSWSKKAIAEAKRFCDVRVVASSEADKFTSVPPQGEWRLDPNAAYVHYTPNETIGGVEFPDVPQAGDVPVVGDMSSSILSRPVDVTRFGIIYAGAQKNMGIPGLTVVVIREDLLRGASPQTPLMLDYTHHAEQASLASTAPTFAWYLAGLVLDWIDEQGGVSAIAEANRRKAERLYGFIDGSNYYVNPVEEASRSRMNVPFTLPDSALDATFLAEAAEQGLVGLKGHRFVGGMRASLYNVMPEEGVERLVDFMTDFMRRHG